jgi:hypothetical protein
MDADFANARSDAYWRNCKKFKQFLIDNEPIYAALHELRQKARIVVRLHLKLPLIVIRDGITGKTGTNTSRSAAKVPTGNKATNNSGTISI